MKFILAAPGNRPDDWPLMQKAAVEAEELGFWAFLLPDHFMGGRDFGGDSTLDTWLAVSYLAPLTDNIASEASSHLLPCAHLAFWQRWFPH